MKYKYYFLFRGIYEPVTLQSGEIFKREFDTEAEAREFVENEDWVANLPNNIKVSKQNCRGLFIWLSWK